MASLLCYFVVLMASFLAMLAFVGRASYLLWYRDPWFAGAGLAAFLFAWWTRRLAKIAEAEGERWKAGRLSEKRKGRGLTNLTLSETGFIKLPEDR